ncbi:MAG: tRNA lysidine(34) synthetase TilS [Bacteroidaceae bacterium]|nr:tRNA lysidine(34) synthetase TilS [Bacteroidaceae bacterium]
MQDSKNILRRVSQYIDRHKMIGDNRRVLVALSGGADSVALLHILHSLNHPVIAAHCNFTLRGEESERDEQFVRDLCQRFGIPCHVKRFETRSYAAIHHLSIETAARALRYEWFEALRQATDCSCVAVAHHIEDQAETILLKIIRGTGIRGLTGMHPVRNKIVRPLLCLHKQEILRYLASNDLNYVTDSTNLERDALRNRIRLDVIPLLETINPKVSTSLSRMAEDMLPILDFFRKDIRSLFQQHNITSDFFPLYDLASEPYGALLLHEWLYGKGFNRTQEHEMMRSGIDSLGTHWQSSRVLDVRRVVSGLKIDYGYRPVEQLTIKQEIVSEVPSDYDPHFAYFDADELIYPLKLRRVKESDCITPFGRSTPVKINKIMKKARIRYPDRLSQWVLCHGDELLWIVNVRSSNLHRVTERTKSILRISVPALNNMKLDNNTPPT